MSNTMDTMINLVGLTLHGTFLVIKFEGETGYFNGHSEY